MLKYLCLKNLTILLLIIHSCVAIPKPEEEEEENGNIPNIPPHNPLEHDSHNEKHFDGIEHNAEYDHEAFLGEADAKTFKELTPEESKRRLGLIVDRIDDDKDGFITVSELKRWIEFVQRRYIDEDVERIWRQYNPDNNETMTLDHYSENVYGFLQNLSQEELEFEHNGVSYQRMLDRDRRRWSMADKNKDGVLNIKEFTAFLHPEDHEDMKEVVLLETIEDIDKDKDGKVSVDEYIGDMYRGGDSDEEEPEWVTSERVSFKTVRDMDGDGFMDKEEVRAWIAPKDYVPSEAEAQHLIFEADENDDKMLTKEEVLDKYDVFVGSQATSFGDELARHDEF